MKITIFTILIGFLFLACRKKDIEPLNYSIFPNVINEKSLVLETPDVLSFVGDMEIIDSFLITVDLMADPFFQIFSLSPFDYIGGSVNRGSGPNEENTIFPYLTRNNDSTFIFRTDERIKLAIFNDKDKKIECLKQIELPGDIMDIIPPIIIGNNIYGISNSIAGNHEYVRFDFLTNRIDFLSEEFPSVPMKVNNEKRKILFSNLIGNRPDGKLFAALYDKFPLLRIYDSEGALLFESYYNNNQNLPLIFNEDRIAPDELKSIMVNYLKLKTTQNYIFGLYSGKTHGELKTQERRVDDYGHEIHVWDWTGSPVLRIILNMEVFSFAVSQRNDFIIASSVNKNNRIYKYDISQYLIP
jgi:hypothetical protein